jgi:hypothetical protein
VYFHSGIQFFQSVFPVVRMLVVFGIHLIPHCSGTGELAAIGSMLFLTGSLYQLYDAGYWDFLPNNGS